MPRASTRSSRVKGRPGGATVAKRIQIDLLQQCVEAYVGGARVFRLDCVTGDGEHPTDRGAFRINRKHHPYRSRVYGVRMDYAMFFTDDGKALHQYHGPVPLSIVRLARNHVSEWFGSHGCVRLSEADARRLYEWAPVGTMVQVS
jgi:lipoprotein-anchoring transpeptidase ErfK/SrfK